VDVITATSAGSASANSNTFSVTNGEKFIFTYNFDIGSIYGITVGIYDGTDTLISEEFGMTSSAVGSYEFTATKTDLVYAYLRIDSVGGTWNIGRVSLRRKAGDFINIQYTNTKDIQGADSIFYASGFTQEVYLDTNLNSPTHEMIETGDEKNGVFQPEKMVDKLIYNIVSYESRNMFKALRLLPMHDSITITDEVGNEYTPDKGNVRVDGDWTTYDTCTLRINFNEDGDVWTNNMDNIT